MLFRSWLVGCGTCTSCIICQRDDVVMPNRRRQTRMGVFCRCLDWCVVSKYLFVQLRLSYYLLDEECCNVGSLAKAYNMSRASMSKLVTFDQIMTTFADTLLENPMIWKAYRRKAPISTVGSADQTSQSLKYIHYRPIWWMGELSCWQ